MNTITIAMLGKGGVGKTMLSAVFGKIFSDMGKRILLVDADPVQGLTTALDIKDIKTIGQARVEIIQKARMVNSEEEKERIADIIDYLLMESLYETPDFSLITMGQTDRLGCFCPINSLLRNTIQSIGSQYDIIIIDAEAGIEQVNRQVVETVDYPVIVSDNTMRGMNTAFMIADMIERIPVMEPRNTGILFNRIEDTSDEFMQRIESSDLSYYGYIKPDKTISEMDMNGQSLFDIANNASSVSEIKTIIEKNILIS